MEIPPITHSRSTAFRYKLLLSHLFPSRNPASTQYLEYIHVGPILGLAYFFFAFPKVFAKIDLKSLLCLLTVDLFQTAGMYSLASFPGFVD